MLHITRIAMQHPLYQQERELRNKILLRPIGVPDYGWEMNDSKSWHFVAIDDAKVIGCVLLVPLDENVQIGQLIQMAVDHHWQGKGVGKKLVKDLVAFAKTKEFTEIVIHSRAEVTSFYEALGFKTFGDEFEEVGVVHRHLRMSL
ncbi:GNAT family N-acetyltransferase [Lutimonas halocynthiae]|uniref:GNAT family N-acetyltransferase n=1 Tax=Lutimonas halocynthiae TaxID=1446477 RepID=UPI0025B5D0DF|nr:GNAT family N-acetyltransferase [Lutimonas halocynthiae]MDN3642349.1 GNAT family N-acetyltransferase [Lutimonas halocynthiae]